MIPGMVCVSLALVWLGGIFYATNNMAAAYITTALGAGWLGIIYAALYRHAQECHNAKPPSVTRIP